MASLAHRATSGVAVAATAATLAFMGTAAQAANPPGNNGTVKIAGVGDIDRIPNNSPHQTCTFTVQWYGFDQGADVVSHVTFTPQAPTKDVTIAVNGPSSVFVGGDPASGAGTSTGLDGTATYTLSFSGGAPAKQGYHVRLVVATPHSQGNDTKSKVFWVQPCAATPTTTPTTTPSSPPGSAPQGQVMTAAGPAIPLSKPKNVPQLKARHIKAPIRVTSGERASTSSPAERWGAAGATLLGVVLLGSGGLLWRRRGA